MTQSYEDIAQVDHRIELLESSSDSEDDEEFVREIFLIFQNSHGFFFSDNLEPGFEHVFAIERQALGWVCHDPSMYDYISVLLPASWTTDVIGKFHEQNPGSTIVQIFVTKSSNAKLFRFSWLNCIGLIQYLLGVYWPWILTPYGLYCRVVKGNNHIKVGRVWQISAEARKLQRKHRRKQTKSNVKQQ